MFLLASIFQDGGGGGGGGLGGIVGFILGIAVLVGWWVLFTKAGKPGWAAIIPIYNLYVILQIVGRPAWWLILFFVPGVNFIVLIVLMLDLAKSFGKDTVFAILLILFAPIMILVLAFGDAQYVGPAAAKG